jgi:hypothetical protein
LVSPRQPLVAFDMLRADTHWPGVQPFAGEPAECARKKPHFCGFCARKFFASTFSE